MLQTPNSQLCPGRGGEPPQEKSGYTCEGREVLDMMCEMGVRASDLRELTCV